MFRGGLLDSWKQPPATKGKHMFSRSGQTQVLSQPSSRLRSGVLAALFAVGLLAVVPVAA